MVPVARQIGIAVGLKSIAVVILSKRTPHAAPVMDIQKPALRRKFAAERHVVGRQAAFFW
jgi:hypothetical protein